MGKQIKCPLSKVNTIALKIKGIEYGISLTHFQSRVFVG